MQFSSFFLFFPHVVCCNQLSLSHGNLTIWICLKCQILVILIKDMASDGHHVYYMLCAKIFVQDKHVSHKSSVKHGTKRFFMDTDFWVISIVIIRKNRNYAITKQLPYILLFPYDTLVIYSIKYVFIVVLKSTYTTNAYFSMDIYILCHANVRETTNYLIKYPLRNRALYQEIVLENSDCAFCILMHEFKWTALKQKF